MPLFRSLHRAKARGVDAPCAEPLEGRVLLSTMGLADPPPPIGPTPPPVQEGESDPIVRGVAPTGAVSYEHGRTATNDNNSDPDRALVFTISNVLVGSDYDILIYDASEMLVLTISGVVDRPIMGVASAGDQALADGEYTYEMRISMGGDVQYTTDPQRLVIDTVAPVFTSTPPASMPVTFRYDPETDDEGAEFGLWQYSVEVADPIQDVFLQQPVNTVGDVVFRPPAALLNTPITLTIVATDLAGNASEQTITFTVTGYSAFFPEGYKGNTIDEFLAMTNPHGHEVSYRVNILYERMTKTDVVAEGTIEAGVRGGVTVVARSPDGPLPPVDEAQPYAFEVISDSPLITSISHYDFGSATAATFTDHLSTSWILPAGRAEDGVRDFLVWYNPADTAAAVQIDFFADDGTLLTTMHKTTSAFRRDGLDVSGVGLPAGRYTAVVTADHGIVASLTQYVTADHAEGPAAFMAIGVPDGGSTSSAVPLVLAGSAAALRIHNPGGAAASITFTFTDEAGATVTHSVGIGAGLTTTLSIGDVAGLTPGARYSLSYVSDQPVAIVAVQRAHDDLVAAPFAPIADSGDAFAFADGFMNPDRAGVDVFETVAIYNPHATDAVEATVTLHFTDGFALSTTLQIEAGRSGFLDLHEWEALLEQGSGFERFFYSVTVEADGPVIAGMWHFDLTLGGDTPAGGFAVLGAPVSA